VKVILVLSYGNPVPVIVISYPPLTPPVGISIELNANTELIGVTEESISAYPTGEMYIVGK